MPEGSQKGRSTYTLVSSHAKGKKWRDACMREGRCRVTIEEHPDEVVYCVCLLLRRGSYSMRDVDKAKICHLVVTPKNSSDPQIRSSLLFLSYCEISSGSSANYLVFSTSRFFDLGLDQSGMRSTLR